MTWWLMYFERVFCLLTVMLPIPLFCLSVYFARKQKPILGGTLALAKLYATIRVSSELWALIWDKAVPGTKWQLFGAGHNTATVIFFSALLVIGAACFLINACTFIKRLVANTSVFPSAQA